MKTDALHRLTINGNILSSNLCKCDFAAYWGIVQTTITNSFIWTFVLILLSTYPTKKSDWIMNIFP